MELRYNTGSRHSTFVALETLEYWHLLIKKNKQENPFPCTEMELIAVLVIYSPTAGWIHAER